MTRRTFVGGVPLAMAAQNPAEVANFQIACMTLVHLPYSFERSVKGIAAAGYRYVAWGPYHTDAAGKRVMTLDSASVADARQMARQCRDQGLEPVLAFGNFYPELPDGVEVYKKRIEQLEAAGIPRVLTFSSTRGTEKDVPAWLKNMTQIAGVAEQAKVKIAVKQHGGITGSGEMTAKLLRTLGHPQVELFYDAGNVWGYLNVDPSADLKLCGDGVKGFAIKDFRVAGKKRAACGPGFGMVDHFQMMERVANNGQVLLACETVGEPFVGAAASPEAVDALARRAREYLETMARAVKASLAG